jgi:hypothetical protein
MSEGTYGSKEAILAAVFIGALSGGSVVADVNNNPRVAFFGFALINTSLEPTSPCRRMG